MPKKISEGGKALRKAIKALQRIKDMEEKHGKRSGLKRGAVARVLCPHCGAAHCMVGSRCPNCEETVTE